MEGLHRDYNNVLHVEADTIYGVGSMPNTMGYVGYPLYKRSTDTVRALELDSGDGCVAPTPATIADGTYKPLARRLYVYPAARALARPAMEAFLQFYLDNVETVAPKVGLVPLTDEQLAESAAELRQLSDKAGDTPGESGG